eukprot:Gregarina_sp_Poly_1__6975@NODE_379_length_9079_cov_111_368842_g312_i0_p2_GENE_NODE_379_length_9079_cov_111_368842_g312_i0NODE_379_length_9079_cov_111_368842_g312_i0_p2_ORF_typecomplete_len708_score111_80TPP_enzyme_N/PF02776_18/2_4e23TPP_enzyme_N/PF02776_18/6_9e03TPP_enzyme_M/PF00205_22/5e03TPP_enzyme_M/PF00205_22/3_4e14TPP_enzyme_M/PF00205_22/8_8e02TPP_enzyme_C/PF02775_21/4_6e03TPP_enzyme_C/PF02775_21/1_5e03TPP_enzyme_C/PF02775_21/2_7e14Pept_tRNA_hydro/PF01195_19/0_04POR_N/PF01855_19/16POR_N/PF0
MGEFVAECFRRAGIRAVFTVPGAPITETLSEIRRRGFTYVCCMRNEQQAAQAAAAYGYHAGSGVLPRNYVDAVVTAMAPARKWHSNPRLDFEWGRMNSQEQTGAHQPVADLLPLERNEAILHGLLSFQPIPVTPGVCVTTCGPAFLNSLSGLGTAHANHWPLVIIAASHSDNTSQTAVLEFQEFPQLTVANGFKEAGALKEILIVKSAREFYAALLKAISVSLSDVPGAVYIDVAWQVWKEGKPGSELLLSLTNSLNVTISMTPVNEEGWATSQILETYKAAKKPLIILGDELNFSMGSMARFLIRNSPTFLRAPILTTPMSKGLVPDLDPRNASGARSKSLKESDCIFAIGVDLNWQFDNSSGWMNNKSKVFVMSSRPHTIVQNAAYYPVQGNVTALFLRFLQGISKINEIKHHEEWRQEIEATVQAAWKSLKTRVAETYSQEVTVEEKARRWKGGLKLDHCFSCLVAPLKERDATDYSELLPKTQLLLALWMGVDSISDPLHTFVCEGATSMDRSRLFLPGTLAKSRLDAGQLGAMGIGAAFAIGTAVWKQVFFNEARNCLADLEPSPQLGPLMEHIRRRASVFLIQGDSAFGFSGLEFETIRRYNLPIAICVLDNGGMYAMDEAEDKDTSRPNKLWSPDYCLKHIAVSDLTPDFKFADLGTAAHLPSETINWPWDNKIAQQLPCLVHFIIDPSDGSNQGYVKSL